MIYKDLVINQIKHRNKLFKTTPFQKELMEKRKIRGKEQKVLKWEEFLEKRGIHGKEQNSWKGEEFMEMRRIHGNEKNS